MWIHLNVFHCPDNRVTPFSLGDVHLSLYLKVVSMCLCQFHFSILIQTTETVVCTHFLNVTVLTSVRALISWQAPGERHTGDGSQVHLSLVAKKRSSLSTTGPQLAMVKCGCNFPVLLKHCGRPAASWSLPHLVPAEWKRSAADHDSLYQVVRNSLTLLTHDCTKMWSCQASNSGIMPCVVFFLCVFFFFCLD